MFIVSFDDTHHPERSLLDEIQPNFIVQHSERTFSSDRDSPKWIKHQPCAS
jgi:hypothetical protein